MNKTLYPNLQLAINQYPEPTKAKRQKSLAHFEQQGIPSKKNDHWKYTNLAGLDFTAYQVPINKPNQWNNPYIEVHQPVNFITFVNGYFVHSQCQDNIQIQITDFQSEASLKSFACLNQALQNDGFKITISDNQNIQAPIYIYHLTDGSSPWLINPISHIQVGSNSQVTFIECYTAGQSPALYNARTRFHIDKNTQIWHNLWHKGMSTARSLHQVDVYLQAHATYHHQSFSIYENQCRIELNTYLQGDHAQVEVSHLDCAKQTTNSDFTLQLNHQAHQGISHALIHSIAEDKAQIACTGKIYVQPEAKQNNANLIHKGLILSNTAEINSRPQLEIYHDEVQCSHGSAIGFIDEALIFYCQTRGLLREEAIEILLHGFVAPLVEKITVPAIQNMVLKQLRTEHE